MSTTGVTRTVKVGGVLTDVTTMTCVVTRTDLGTTIANTATHPSTGIYKFVITDPALGLTYNFTITTVYLGATDVNVVTAYGPLSALTETTLVNQAIARLGGTLIVDLNTDTTTEAVAARLHYAATRDALLRSHSWNFATAVVELTPANAVQTVEIAGILTAGTYTITATDSLGVPVTTAAIDFDASTSDVATALNAVLGASAVAVAGTAQSNMTLTFSGTGYANVIQNKVTLAISGLTGATGYHVHQRRKWELPTDFLRLIRTRHDHWRGYHVEGSYLVAETDEMWIRYVQQVTDVTLFDPLFADVLVLALAMKFLGPLSLDASLRPTLEGELADKLATARTVNMVEEDGGRRPHITWLQARHSWRSAAYDERD